MPGWMLGLVDNLFEGPIILADKVHKQFGVPLPTARQALKRLEELNIVREITGRERGRIYAAEGIFGAVQ